MRTRITALLTVLVLGLLAPSAALAQTAPQLSTEAEEQLFLDQINASRAEAGLAALVMNADLRDVARGWTAQMAASQQLAHNPSYSAQYPGEWRRMAENVGYTSSRGSSAQTVAYMHSRFMASPGHHRNIVGGYNQVGIGVARDSRNKLWVTVNFLEGPVPPAEVPALPQFFRRAR